MDNREIGWEYITGPRVVYYKIRAVDQANITSAYMGTQRFDCNNGPHLNSAKGELVNENTVPKNFKFQANYPNTFNPTTQIVIDLPESGDVTLTVYDMTGRVVSTLVNGYKAAGRYDVTFDGTNLASGAYIYRLEAGRNFVETKKLLLVK